MNALEIRDFDGTNISFLMAGRNVKVNATEMAKIYNKRVSDFLENDGVKAFISEMEFTLNSGNSSDENLIKIVETKGTKGTWMHRALALKFAAWLNVKFEVWIYSVIDQLIFGQLPELAQEKFTAIDEIADAELKLQSTPEYKAYQEAIDKKKKIEKAIKNQQENQLMLFSGR